MKSAAEYRLLAQACVESAQTATAAQRPMLLHMAQSWLKLADEAAATNDDVSTEAKKTSTTPDVVPR